jgi:hypothetical protein
MSRREFVKHASTDLAVAGFLAAQAAKIGGVRNYFVEQNMDLTKESVAFLKTLKV